MKRTPAQVSVDAPKARPTARSHRSRGQSLVEFALILPVLLLIVLGGIDFGRVFLGWVALNNTARIAANYAASNASLMNAGNAAALTSYNRLVQQDATTTNCKPANPIPPPTFSPNAGVGSDATVRLSCQFDILTPILSSFLGGRVTVSASAIFPVRTGIIANVPVGGGANPVAAFNVSPQTGIAPLTVTFSNQSTGNPTTYAWDYESDGVIDSSVQNPPVHIYSVPGVYTATLTVSNGLATTSATRTITVTTPPGPIANFTLTPSSGTAPLSVTFTNTSTGTITTYAWDLDGNGTIDDNLLSPPSKTYAAGTWNVTLTVTDSFGQSSSTTKQVIAAAVV
ncbi:MAG: PKD domain-containing protein, partial [Candidatus Limnocylindrales bacterium]